MLILSPEMPKRLSITMANILFGAMSGVRPVNCQGNLIHKYVEKFLPHIDKKPSYLSPYILHLYQHHDCITREEEDMLTIAEDEVVYKLGPEVEVVETGTEDSSDTAVTEPAPTSPTPKIRKPTSPPPPPPGQEAGPSREALWKDVDMSTWDFLETPLQASPGGVDGTPEPVFPDATHSSRGEPGSGQLWTRKHPPGIDQADGLEED